MLITTDHIVFETLTLIQPTVKRNAHTRAVWVGEMLYREKLARIYRTNFQEEVEAFAYLKLSRHPSVPGISTLWPLELLKRTARGTIFMGLDIMAILLAGTRRN